MKVKVASCAFAAAVAAGVAPALAQIRVVTMNASNATDLGDQATPRTPWMQTILTAIGTHTTDDPSIAGNSGIAKPIDVLLLQENTGPTSTSLPYRNLLNSIYPGANYSYSTTGGNSTGAGTQGLVFNANALTLVGTVALGTASTTGQPRQTLRYQLRPVGYTNSSADIYIYNSHYKAGDSAADEARRLPEAQVIRANADALAAAGATNFIYAGDYNVYRNTDPSYQQLMSAGGGQAVDPINRQGNWNNGSTFHDVHTQSPFNSATATTLGTGFTGTGGGMDDRFDQQLVSTGVNDGDGFAYIPNSYQAFGNNGTMLYGTGGNPINHSSNNFPGTTPAERNGTLLDDLASILDHLPVIADYQLPAKLSATGTAAPAKVIKNASVGVTVNVWNAAPVTFVNGADQLSYTLATSGTLSGATSGTDNALGTTNAHTVALSTATVGAKSGSYSVTSTSQQDGGAPLSQNVNYTVVDHANASLSTPADTDAQTIDFGYIPQNFMNRTAGFSVTNLEQNPGFTAKLDIDTVSTTGDSTRLTTNAAPTGATPINGGATNNYTATALTNTVGNFSAIQTLANSDENIPGATNGTSLTLTTTSRIISTGDFPVTGFINLFSGETFSTGPATIGAGVNLTKSGVGTLRFSGTQTHGASSNLLVTGGAVVFDTDAGSGSSAPLAVSLNAAGTSATFNSTQHLRNLALTASTSAALTNNGNRTLYTDSLSIDGSAGLDLADNDLVVNNAAFTDIKSLVLAGFGASTGITSSTSDGSQILALFDNGLVGAGDWNGSPIGTNAIVGKYTYFGDVNFDGQVTGDDYTIVDSNLNTTPPVGFEWLSGDANLDGLVTGDDYTTIDSNLGLGSGNPLVASAIVPVPEPAAASVLGFAAATLTLRRRRRNSCVAG